MAGQNWRRNKILKLSRVNKLKKLQHPDLEEVKVKMLLFTIFLLLHLAIKIKFQPEIFSVSVFYD